MLPQDTYQSRNKYQLKTEFSDGQETTRTFKQSRLLTIIIVCMTSDFQKENKKVKPEFGVNV